MRILILALLLFAPLAFAGEPTLVYLVRHAEKVDSSAESDLSPRGKQRAQELAQFFEKISIDGFFSSQYKRTRNTLVPLAEKQGKTIQVVDAGTPQVLIDKVRQHEGKTLLIAGHSNTVPDLIKRLGGPEVTIDHSEYRNLFLVVISDDGAVLQNFQMAP